MSSALLRRLPWTKVGSFARQARTLGLKDAVARLLEEPAQALSPDAPEKVFEDRSLYEAVALRAVIGDAGNLELSFGPVDLLANAVETLGLARASDVPDPFRRVWVDDGMGNRVRGVVLTQRGGEVAVFCPASAGPKTRIGELMSLEYRGLSSDVRFPLRLNDSVRLPGALVLHFTRPQGSGSIGRDNQRFAVDLSATVIGSEPFPCWIRDVSSGGMMMECSTAWPQGEELTIDMPLPDGGDGNFLVRVVVRWCREGQGDELKHGLEFVALPSASRVRLDRYLDGRREAGDGLEQAA